MSDARAPTEAEAASAFGRAAGAWEVRAGIIPQVPRLEFTKRWVYLKWEREEDEKNGRDMTYHARFSQLRAAAIDYFMQVSMPNINNWADITFIWF